MVFWTLLACEVFMVITGIVTLVMGRFPYRPGRPVTGVAAYVAGVIMCLPMAVGFPIARATYDEERLSDAIGKEIVIRAVFIILSFCSAYFTAAILFNPSSSQSKKNWLKEVERRKSRRRKKSEDEDEEERPRKRRRPRDDDDEDADERPRRRRRERDEDDDDDDRPRRRRPADEDDEPRRPHRSGGPPPLPPRR